MTPVSMIIYVKSDLIKSSDLDISQLTSKTCDKIIMYVSSMVTVLLLNIAYYENIWLQFGQSCSLDS